MVALLTCVILGGVLVSMCFAGRLLFESYTRAVEAHAKVMSEATEKAVAGVLEVIGKQVAAAMNPAGQTSVEQIDDRQEVRAQYLAELYNERQADPSYQLIPDRRLNGAFMPSGLTADEQLRWMGIGDVVDVPPANDWPSPNGAPVGVK